MDDERRAVDGRLDRAAVADVGLDHLGVVPSTLAVVVPGSMTARTPAPRRSAARTMWDPMKPPAPVTATTSPVTDRPAAGHAFRLPGRARRAKSRPRRAVDEPSFEALVRTSSSASRK